MAKCGLYPLGSGSKGNSLYFKSPRASLLIDAGLSAKKIQERLQELEVEIESIDAILVTHEHIDHIQGLKVLAFKKNIPVFANQETAKGIVEHFGACPKFKVFSTGESFLFKDLTIHPFSIQHDTLDPVAFTFQCDALKVGVCTDLGFATSLVRTKLQGCDYLYVEANHQPAMVHASPRPMVYKQRVLSRHGHLSNEACGELLSHVYHEGLKHVHLAHLSSECNTPETALQVVRESLSQSQLPEIPLSIAHQDKISQAVFF